VLHCLGEYASSFLFVYGEEPDLSVLKEWAVILSIDCSNWHGMVKHKCISAEEHNVLEFQSMLTMLCSFFLSDSGVCHSSFCCFIWGRGVRWLHPWLLDAWSAMEECVAISSPMQQMGDGEMNVQGPLVIAEHAWNQLSSYVMFP
jgi:hypothetical protein